MKLTDLTRGTVVDTPARVGVITYPPGSISGRPLDIRVELHRKQGLPGYIGSHYSARDVLALNRDGPVIDCAGDPRAIDPDRFTV